MERLHRFSFFQSLQVFGKQLSLLDGYLCQLRVSVGIVLVRGLDTLVADCENMLSSLYTVKFVYLDSSSPSQ